ncbi:hypothetical protein [Streptomyces virginiae]|uniref:hypothetical protein n=1 Tax=Streptomyces virginiae TaxID=1961 RepID=UPI00224F3D4D|nr:hypothetical protein [Streptomyces virginiae]MCX4959642.1 hypothetical protein [Streptomyces virginiae]
MNHDDALRQLSHMAHERAFGLHVGSDRLVQAGLDALMAGVESPSIAILAGLLRREEPEAPALFQQVLEELGLLFEPPVDFEDDRWAFADWIASRIVDGYLDPAVGARLIWSDVDAELGCPEDLMSLVRYAVDLDGWDENCGVSVDALKQATIEAAAELLSKRRPPCSTVPG